MEMKVLKFPSPEVDPRAVAIPPHGRSCSVGPARGLESYHQEPTILVPLKKPAVDRSFGARVNGDQVQGEPLP
jgi:hypothetical protein